MTASQLRPRSTRSLWRPLASVAVAVAASVAVACSQADAPTTEVPLQTGEQTAVPLAGPGTTSLAVDGHNVLYLGGTGISTLAPGATRPTPLKLDGYPQVSTMASAPDGTLSFVTLGGVVQTLPPGSPAPQPLPFDTLRQFSQIAVAQDGTVYLGDDVRDKLFKLGPGETTPTELAVNGVDGPGHMVIDADDTLYVSMMGEIVKIPEDATTAEPVEGVSDHVGGLAVDTAGNLYATDVEANTVSRMPAGGGDWAQLPFTGLQSPTDIAVDRAGNVYVMHRGSEIVRLAAG